MKNYPIETSQDEFRRLEMQSDLFRADAVALLQRIGVGPGLRCLDLCCAIGGIADILSRRLGSEAA